NLLFCNVYCVALAVKQKNKSNAEFLSVRGMLFDVCGIPTTILEVYGSHEDRIRRSRPRGVMTAIRQAECESVDAIHSRTTLGGSGARSRCTESGREIADRTINGSGANWKGS